MLVDFKQLESFIEVVNLKSFSKAANKLYLSQPTITSHIQNLESELKTFLLNRNGRKISPTNSGMIFYKYATNILSLKEMAQFQLKTYKNKVNGHLTISSSSVPKQYILPPILKSFTDKYQDVTFTINHNNSQSVIEDILDGYIDFGIVGTKHKNNSLKYIDLLEDTLFLVTPNLDKYNYENFKTLNKEFILKEKFLFRTKGSGSRLLIEKKLEESNLNISNLNVVSYLDDNESIKTYIKLNMGISFMSSYAIANEVNSGIFKAFNIEGLNLHRSFYFVYNKNKYLSPLANTFKDFIIDNIPLIKNPLFINH